MSFHADGTIVLYPMATAARRLERNVDGMTALLSASGLRSAAGGRPHFHERSGHFLEGTGSLVLDRPRRRAYASLSPRTDRDVIADFDEQLDYSTLVFDARGPLRPADLPHQRAAEPRHPLRRPVHRSGRAGVSRGR